jgi:RNA polymerase sigma-70 factor (ECF subfamily)
MGKALSDEELVSRFVGGDKAAFGALVSRHEQRVYNVALRMLGRPDDARDAAQDAFLSAMRSLPNFRGEAAFSTWLHRVTINACYDILRKGKRVQLAADPNGEDRRREEGPPAPDHADTTATAIDVQRALVRVPEEFRAVLVLHDVQDLSYEQVGEALGIPVGTVKSRLHRARVSLAGFLGESGTTRQAPGTSERPGASKETR